MQVAKAVARLHIRASLSKKIMFWLICRNNGCFTGVLKAVKILIWIYTGLGSRKFCQESNFFSLLKSYFTEGREQPYQYLSGPPLASETPINSMAFRWWADDGIR